MHCRPVAFLLTGGQVADCTAADKLARRHHAEPGLVHADKGYDTNAVRQKIEAKGAAPNIPPKRNRIWKNCFSPVLYRNRNAIERMFGRLKDFPQGRHKIRQTRRNLPCNRLPRRYRQLLVMSLEPKWANPLRSPAWRSQFWAMSHLAPSCGVHPGQDVSLRALQRCAGSDYGATAESKVFCFFFSKKKTLLRPARLRSNRTTAR